MVRKQVLRAREDSRESLLEKVKSESNQDKLAFNITYYPVFQNVRNNFTRMTYSSNTRQGA